MNRRQGAQRSRGRTGGVSIGLIAVLVLLASATDVGAKAIGWAAGVLPDPAVNAEPTPTEHARPGGGTSASEDDLGDLDGCDRGLPGTVTETDAGIAELDTSDYECAAAIIDQVEPTTTAADGYHRDAFGPAWTDEHTATWGSNGCDTRNDILDRDLTDVSLDEGSCTVLAGVLDDPFTGATIHFNRQDNPNEVHIDHLVPLAYAWRKGADQWQTQQRVDFANDPLNLAAVDGRANMAKGDHGPADWTPEGVSECAYSLRFATIVVRYGLPVKPDDRDVMTAACAQ